MRKNIADGVLCEEVEEMFLQNLGGQSILSTFNPSSHLKLLNFIIPENAAARNDLLTAKEHILTHLKDFSPVLQTDLDHTATRIQSYRGDILMNYEELCGGEIVTLFFFRSVSVFFRWIYFSFFFETFSKNKTHSGELSLFFTSYAWFRFFFPIHLFTNFHGFLLGRKFSFHFISLWDLNVHGLYFALFRRKGGYCCSIYSFIFSVVFVNT